MLLLDFLPALQTAQCGCLEFFDTRDKADEPLATFSSSTFSGSGSPLMPRSAIRSFGGQVLWSFGSAISSLYHGKSLGVIAAVP